MPTPPELAIIIPVLNEAEILPALFHSLAQQEGVAIEAVICDGGSSDGSGDLALRAGYDVPFPVNVISCERGRGRQLNAGVATSRGETLLFLHADSRLASPLALRRALDNLCETMAKRGSERIAGHFPLAFSRGETSPSLAYYFYECKARLNRRECTHGDQGFMLRRGFFAEAGPFDTSLPMLAETRFAESVRQKGEWILFPDRIVTSARRFESEGIYTRQMLNAIIMDLAATGWETILLQVPAIYAGSGEGGCLGPAAILRTISKAIASLPLRQRLSLWRAAGDYVRSHAWQIPFFLDTRRNFRRGLPAGEGGRPLLDFHDRRLARLIDRPPFLPICVALTWLWFRLTCLHSKDMSSRG